MLVVFFCLAILVSFACSIFEAVLLSVSQPFIATMKATQPIVGKRWEALKTQIDGPLTSILTLNTIAHTVGSIGVGKEVAGLARGSSHSGWIEGLTAALMTFAVLVLSEIIPKTVGARYWRRLAPMVGFLLEKLTWLMTPVVWFIRLFGGSSHSEAAFSREELKVMADIGQKEGKLQEGESRILKNLLHMRDNEVGDVMTPRVVVFSLPEESTVGEYMEHHEASPFSRLLLYRGTLDHVTGMALRDDVLRAAAGGQSEAKLSEFSRPVPSVPESLRLTQAFDQMVTNRHHIAIVADDYGGLAGLVTLEDIVETLLGLEIVDEADTRTDMREFARSQWEKRAKKMGLSIEVSPPPGTGEVPPGPGPEADGL
ncbi:CNNM domain-containing protein [Aeoliella sp.]|uniref:CNNM domain-containing protein n=1 Tax=Aeoliella sp. TaxID=2795800 RepID=UPI003CCBFFC8